ncbi:MAG: hypothetical protein KTR20_05795 [Cellvibrionaceae bacterium]|nr:hypothetical protein [Cellvibrionaceae bacterium]
MKRCRGGQGHSAQKASASKCLTIIAVLSILLSACDGEQAAIVSDTASATSSSTTTSTRTSTITRTDEQTSAIDPQREALRLHLWQLAAASIETTLAAAARLASALDHLLSQPTAAHLAAAQAQWRESYRAYYQLLPFMYVSATAGESVSVLKHYRFQLAAWPFYPGYIDSYGPYLDSGIVNAASVSLSAENVRKQHGLTHAEEAVLGWYALEFMLWGDKGRRSEKAFTQQHTLPASLLSSGLQPEQLPNNRRRRLLAVQSQLLLVDLQSLKQQWHEAAMLSMNDPQWPVEQGLRALHDSVQAYLQSQLARLQAEQRQDNPPPVLTDAFAGHWQQAIKHSLDTLEQIYFAKPEGLAHFFLTPAKQQQLHAMLIESQTQFDIPKETAARAAILADLASVLGAAHRP